MELSPQDWRVIRLTCKETFRSTFHFAIASVNPDNTPHVTPIGSLILRDFPKGFFFERSTVALPRNLETNNRVCVLGVPSDKWTYLKHFFRGRFAYPAGIRLSGIAGKRREATTEELALFHARVRRLRLFKGYKLLWGNLKYVREITFDSYQPIQIDVGIRATEGP